MVNRTVMMDNMAKEQSSLIDLNFSNMALTDYNMVTDGTTNMQQVPINTINLNLTKNVGLENSSVNINAWFSNNQQYKQGVAQNNSTLYTRKNNTNSQ